MPPAMAIASAAAWQSRFRKCKAIWCTAATRLHYLNNVSTRTWHLGLHWAKNCGTNSCFHGGKFSYRNCYYIQLSSYGLRKQYFKTPENKLKTKDTQTKIKADVDIAFWNYVSHFEYKTFQWRRLYEYVQVIILHFCQALNYLIVLLSSHVGPQEALNSNSCRALLLVASPGRPHTHILLNDNSCSGSSQKLNITDKKKTNILEIR